MSVGLLLVGASGLAREVLAAGISGVRGILDDDPTLQGRIIGGVPVVGTIDSAARRREHLLVCVGPSATRRCVVERLLDADGDEVGGFATFVARSARVGSSSHIETGSIVLDGTVITADVQIGRHVVIMPLCTVTHDDVIDDVATLAAGVSLGGGVHIGHSAYIGMNASIKPGVTIGSGAVVGMGAVVLNDVPAGETWAGVPARPIDARNTVPAGVLGEHA
ncbi:NeuD/PglB/VioB family sugar acetyltransferase [Microbacterium telephonicum]|uniref:Sugar O-acyltransferase (Sialic acid O-acetyltransferase NeuD family) n=1 Tax=Microbacterium telephonicum TaxID=1714841 RepID=A0A498C6J2_9MICO|nr:NeuD/PglB/VioB family sugar acetyltransferase [Microbacterium telephonicum]RLK47951.1 sugar O-acyltransferase (sialic acid O-acetyltransferase NeuD family) [Microbacterium telephonicum]